MVVTARRPGWRRICHWHSASRARARRPRPEALASAEPVQIRVDRVELGEEASKAAQVLTETQVAPGAAGGPYMQIELTHIPISPRTRNVLVLLAILALGILFWKAPALLNGFSASAAAVP